MTEEEKKRELPARSIMNPFAISTTTPTTTSSTAKPMQRVNPFAMASLSSEQKSTSTTTTAAAATDNVNKFFTNAFSSFRLPQQQQQDTSKSPNNSSGNVFAQFLPPKTAETVSENQQLKQEIKKKEELLKAAMPQAQVNSSISSNATEPEVAAVIPSTENKPDEVAAAALIQELAMESPLPSPSTEKANISLDVVNNKSSGKITKSNPFDNVKTSSQSATQVQEHDNKSVPTTIAPLSSELNKSTTVAPVNPFDNIKAFQKNASKRWIDSIKNITDTVTSETNNLVAEAFGKDDKKDKISIAEEVAVEPTLQNMVWIKIRSNSSWEKCKLALVDSTLFYYPTVNATQPSGTFSVFLQEQQALVSLKPFISSTYSSPTPFGLTLQQPPQYQQEEWFLCFDSYKDMKLWCDALINLVVDVSIGKHVGNWKRDEDEKNNEEKKTIEKKGSIDVLLSEDSKIEEEESPTSTAAESSVKLINWNILLSCSNISLLLSCHCSRNSTTFCIIFILLNIIATSLRLYSNTLFTYAKPILILTGTISETEKLITEETVEEKKEDVKKEKKISGPLYPGFSTIPYSEDIAEEDKQKIQFMISPSDLYQVRRHDYLTSRIKIPSMDSLYDLWKVDLLQCNKRVDHFSSHIQLPEEIINSASTNKWTAPEIFMISLNFPTDPPTLTGSGDDSKGVFIVCYFRMKDSTKKILQKQYSSETESKPTQELPSLTKEEAKESSPSDPDKSIVNAVKLLDEWCKRSPTDSKFQSRFKLIPHGFNLEELGVPSYLIKYNDKPLLIKRQNITGFYRQSPNKILHSFDITFYPFPYIAKQAISYMYSSYKNKMDLSYAFVLEGRDADELPEVILGSVRLKKQDFAKFEKYEDYVDE